MQIAAANWGRTERARRFVQKAMIRMIARSDSQCTIDCRVRKRGSSLFEDHAQMVCEADDFGFVLSGEEPLELLCRLHIFRAFIGYSRTTTA